MNRKPSQIHTYVQNRPEQWLKDNPERKWRCDIFPDDGSDHHGLGATEAVAIHNASLAYLRWISKE